MTFPVGDGSPPPGGPQSLEELPLVYVVTALTALNEDERKLVDGWSDTINRAVIEAGEPEGGGPPTIRCHTPITTSAPWKDSRRTAEQVFDLNFTTVATADALIVLGHGGGGYGGGQEMAWGVAGRIPVLFVYHQDDPLSRQVKGTPADIAFESFSDAAELAIKVRQFIRVRRKDLYRHVAIRQARTLTYSTPMGLLEERWLALPPGQRAALPGQTGIHGRQIESMLSSVHTLALASINEIIALSSALGLGLGELFAAQRLPELSPRELSALRMAAKEFELGGVEVLDLQMRARIELAKGGIRRLPLVSPADWIDFRDEST